jgi:hypothetical protein
MSPLARKVARFSAEHWGYMGTRLRQALRANARRVVSWLALAAFTSLLLGGCSRTEAADLSQTVAVAASSSKAPAAPSASGAHAAPKNATPQAQQGLCDALCARTAQLRCGATASECLTGCLEMAGAPACQAEMLAMLNCMNQHAAADWECDHSMASIRSGFCDAELARVASCISGVN